MSGKRSISTAIWADGWFENLSPSQKLLWFYLLTNDSTNLIGLYEFSLKRCAMALDSTTEAVREMLKAFVEVKRISIYESQTGTWIRLSHHERHNKLTGVLQAQADAQASKLPEYIKEWVSGGYESQYLDQGKRTKDKISKDKIRYMEPHMPAHMESHKDPHMENQETATAIVPSGTHTPATLKRDPKVIWPKYPAVLLTEAEKPKLAAAYQAKGLDKHDLEDGFRVLQSYSENGNAKKFKNYKNHYLVMIGWVLQEVLERKKKQAHLNRAQTQPQTFQQIADLEFQNAMKTFKGTQ